MSESEIEQRPATIAVVSVWWHTASRWSHWRDALEKLP
jgi:hypothetical protein